MDLIIENVESLSLNINSKDQAALFADLFKDIGGAVSVERVSTPCDCPACQARRAADALAASGTQTAAKATADAAMTIPALGEVWPGQGGINAGLKRGRGGSPDYYMIVPLDTRAAITEISWSKEATDTGAISKDDGAANTKLLAESAFDFPAARWAAGLEIEGHKDLYLPSQRELSLAAANVPELFSEGWYWSSTQSSRNLAWLQYFGGGYQDGNLKSAELRARAFRRFIP